MSNDQKATFFPKRKVRLELTNWRPLKSSGGEKRIAIDLTIPLIGETRDGMIPSWAYHHLLAMEREGAADKKTAFDAVLDDMTLEFWATNKSPDRMMLATRATLSAFTLERITRDKAGCPALCFSVVVKAHKGFLCWCWDHVGQFMWVEFTPSQADMELPANRDQYVLGITKGAEQADPSHEPGYRDQTPEEAVDAARDFFAGDGSFNDAVYCGYLLQQVGKQGDDPQAWIVEKHADVSLEQHQRCLNRIVQEREEMNASAAEQAIEGGEDVDAGTRIKEAPAERTSGRKKKQTAAAAGVPVVH